jgi:hypothetical protein
MPGQDRFDGPLKQKRNVVEAIQMGDLVHANTLEVRFLEFSQK